MKNKTIIISVLLTLLIIGVPIAINVYRHSDNVVDSKYTVKKEGNIPGGRDYVEDESYIYYAKMGVGIIRIEKTSGKKEIIIDRESIGKINLIEDKLIYEDYDEDTETTTIYTNCINGDNEKVLVEDVSSLLITFDKCVFYEDRGSDLSRISISGDGTEEKVSGYGGDDYAGYDEKTNTLYISDYQYVILYDLGKIKKGEGCFKYSYSFDDGKSYIDEDDKTTKYIPIANNPNDLRERDVSAENIYLEGNYLYFTRKTCRYANDGYNPLDALPPRYDICRFDLETDEMEVLIKKCGYSYQYYKGKIYYATAGLKQINVYDIKTGKTKLFYEDGENKVSISQMLSNQVVIGKWKEHDEQDEFGFSDSDKSHYIINMKGEELYTLDD